MALTTQLIVKIAGNADGAISAMAKLGKGSRDAFKEVSSSAKTEFERARKEAERAYKDVARLQKEAATAGKGGHSDLANALSSEAARRAVDADKAAAAVVAAEKRIAAESIKTGAITKTALAGGASGAGAAFAREGGAISRVFGTIRTEATKTGAAIKTGLSSGAFEGIGKSAAVAGAGILAGFGFAEKATIGFDKALSGVRAVLDGSVQDLAKLRQAALDAGAATSFTASDAARAEGELAKAGVGLNDILGGALTGSLNLAAAGQIDLADAATVAAQSMTQFGLSGGDVGHIADVLAAGANKSTASVASLSEGLQAVGGVAHMVGFGFEDTIATLALFDQNALRGAEGGTALKTMLLRLVAPLPVVRKELERLNIGVYDSAKNVRPASELFGELRNKLKDLTPEARNVALQTIFGTRAIQGATIAVKEGSAGFDKYRKAVNDQGAASKFASVQMDNLAGDIERFKGSVEVGLIGVGGGATGTLRSLAQAAEGAVNEFSGLPSAVQGGVGIIAGLSGVALTAGGAMAVLGPAVDKARIALGKLGPAGTAANAGLGALGKVGGIAIGVVALGTAMDFLESRMTELLHGKVNFTKLGESVSEFAKSGKVVGEFRQQFGADLSGIGDEMKKIADNRSLLKGPLLDLDPRHRGEIQDAKKDLEGLDKTLASFAAAGHGDAAAKVFERVVEAAAAKGIFRSDVLKFLPKYSGALDNASTSANLNADATGKTGSAADKAAGPVSDLAKQQEELQAAADEAAQSLKKELDALTGLTDLNLGVSNSNIAFIQSLGDLKKALFENGRGFDVNTEAGQKNQKALNDGIAAALAHAQAVGEETGDINAANLVLQQHRSQLIDAATATGISREAATLYVDQLLKIPPRVSTTAAFDGSTAIAGVNTFREAIEKARREAATAITIEFRKKDPFDLAFGGNLGLGGKFAGRFAGGPTRAHETYDVAEQGQELWIQKVTGHKSPTAMEHLTKQGQSEAHETLVRLGIPGGIEPRATRKGAPALLLGTQGPQMFTPPADGVVVNATDTKRLQRTNDPGIIERILKKAGADRKTLEALAATGAPARATGGRIHKGETVRAGEHGPEAAVMPSFSFGSKPSTPTITTPGVKRGSDGSYNITIGDTHLKVEAGTSGSAKGINKSDVDKIVERKQAELVQELIAAMRSG